MVCNSAAYLSLYLRKLISIAARILINAKHNVGIPKPIFKSVGDEKLKVCRVFDLFIFIEPMVE